MDYSGTGELINLNFINTPESLFISNQCVLPNVSELLCVPAFHLLSESKLFTPRVGGNSHSSSITQALATAWHSEMLIEIVIREV